MYAPPLRYKRRALASHEDALDSLVTLSTLSKAKGSQTQHKLGFTPNNLVLNLLRAQAIEHTVDVGYYAPAVRTTLNPCVFIVFWHLDRTNTSYPRVLTLWV